MVKDITNSTLTEIKVDFTPATIKVDREAIEAQVAAAIAQYSGREVTVDNYKEVYEERTRFNKLIGGLDTQRKDFNRQINEPAKDFDKWVKEKVIKPIKAVTDAMSEGLNAIDEHERLLRVDVVRAAFESKCIELGLDKGTFTTKYNEYSLKKYFKTGKFELKKTTLDEMDALVLAEFDKLEQYKANIQAVREQAQEYELLADSYVRDLENGKSLVDVLKTMKSDRDAAILRKEQQEAQAKAEAERKAEIERLAQEQANENIKAINADTGEILEDEPIIPEQEKTAPETPKFEPSEPASYDLRITFPYGNPQAKFYKGLFERDGVTTEMLFDGKTQLELGLGYGEE
ncbi:DUF1351 domain-containing protein [Streptococcus anginosus]|uniref:DUF1351 domain-containing protein n=1 Tax=Streptococcus anginosus TaxID=1328 RepID=A0ABT3EAL5_STRAP|nr:DUF1351 domain-containing protein [Streptococcus anginosus]KAA9291753.1 DUF1351 domain-containing protein [Streptococcus anginosus]MCW1042492.1 DUF1351 domain-containing protein [Streptococcus anginosus]